MKWTQGLEEKPRIYSMPIPVQERTYDLPFIWVTSDFLTAKNPYINVTLTHLSYIVPKFSQSNWHKASLDFEAKEVLPESNAFILAGDI